MIVALYILIALVVVGAVLYLLHRREEASGGMESDGKVDDTSSPEDGEECCGMHITCEKDSLLASVSDSIEYYDDEELDRFRGVAPDDYNDDAVEEFRNVLLTLLPEDIAGWARSIQLRGIELPTPVRDELLLIVSEARRSRSVPEM